MTKRAEINDQLQRLVAASDWRFAVGLRIRFNHPTLLYQTYPPEWVAHYAQSGLMFSDPAVLWAMTHTGICDWSTLEDQDVAGVLKLARDYGLVHGIAVSVDSGGGNRSMGFFAHAERPITEAERALALEVVTGLHGLTEGLGDMAPPELAALAALNDALPRLTA